MIAASGTHGADQEAKHPQAARERSFCYFLFGIQLKSNLPLPGLPESQSLPTGEIEVRFNERPTAWLEGRCRPKTLRFRSEPLGESSPPRLQVWSLDDFSCRFLYCDGTEFFVDSSGRRIWATWPSSMTFEDTLTYLLGTIMGFALSRQGITCLHGSVVEVDAFAIGLCGPAGAGKSTTAAAFARRGFRVLSDDVVILDKLQHQFAVRPSYPVLRLWPDSVQHLYGSAEALPLLTPNWEKRGLHLGGRAGRYQHRALPLGALYLLGGRERALDEPRIEAARGAAALMGLVANDFVSLVLEKEELARNFKVLCQLGEHVPIRRVTAPDNPEKLADIPSAIVDDFRRQGRYR
jgi:hypothetical protein